MITTGKITEINISAGEHKHNKCRVELTLFQIPGDNSKSCIFEANCMVPSGFSAMYSVGDIVYVGFLNNDKSLPIILGKLYQGLSDICCGYGAIKDLKVDGSAQLPENCQIGKYSYENLSRLLSTLDLIDIVALQEKVDLLASQLAEHIAD